MSCIPDRTAQSRIWAAAIFYLLLVGLIGLLCWYTLRGLSGR